MRIISVVGARPQFVKAGVLEESLRKKGIENIIVHTGQHYDYNMSDSFFNEFNISADVNLGIKGGGRHAKVVSNMISKLEEVFLEHMPEYVLIHGDTNSTLAASIAAAQLHIKIIHNEAGVRVSNIHIPEEMNRRVADCLSSVFLAPSVNAVKNLAREGKFRNVFFVGDVMYDAVLRYLSKNKESMKFEKYEGIPYCVLTMHREENVQNPENIKSVFNSISYMQERVVFYCHPRTKKVICSNNIKIPDNVDLLDPVGYSDFIKSIYNARFVITDSGGVQKESAYLGKCGIVLLEETPWPEIVDCGYNYITGTDGEKISQAYLALRNRGFRPKSEDLPYGDGNACEKIANIIASL